MASPPSCAVKQESLETMEGGQRVTTLAGGHWPRDNNSSWLLHGEDGKPSEFGIISFQGNGEEERLVRGNELCRLLAERPELVPKFNGLSATQQLLALMLQEPASAKGCAVKEWFLEALELQRYEVEQAILGQEGARDKIKYEG